jgi:hypothetical protein
MRFIERLQSGLADERRPIEAEPVLATARRVFVLLSQARWSGKDGGENCLEGARRGWK